MPFYRWSETAGINGNADPTINYLEGQSPSSINDSARSLMAALRMWGTDISGAIATSGTSTAFAVTSHSVFDSLARMDGQIIAFTPHTTSGGTTTLNVDGLGAKPLRSAPSVELAAGTLVQGTPYVAVYNSSDAAFYLQGFFGNPYSIPVGGVIDFTGSTTPNSSFVFPAGQAISRSTYATYFSLVGTTYGSGDGSTTFNAPDLTGRVIAMKEASATRLTSSYFGGNSTTLGATGGLESHTLTTAQLASHSHANSLSDPGHSHPVTIPSNSGNTGGGGAFGNIPTSSNTSSATTSITITNASAGSGNAHNNTQPTIILNKILRVI
ncbi:tail fiber protein [Bradyrhizobium sp. 139]|uniref:phage tail protein n=1 Tax=Bradyrhizobium sp. 139 TaxID=2782616 RepID=UPI001FFAC613|nr:tail fiber protein [Bradyrhizobium sp. 139]MCK1742218.1 tail fiber protein [Bradyrhizobium sp. 139]